MSRNAGGEDGAVKLLDVFYNCHRRGRGSQAAIDPATETFHRPYAKVVQTLPSHESSVGALAIGMYGRGSSDAHADAHEIGCFKGLESALVVSGGGKMEARAWCMAGVGGHSGSDAGEPREEAVEAACEQPPVRYSSFFRSEMFVAPILGTLRVPLVITVCFCV